jgi:hypothetical protein
VQTIPSWFSTVEVTFHEDTPEAAAAASQLAAAVVATAQQPVRATRVDLGKRTQGRLDLGVSAGWVSSSSRGL